MPVALARTARYTNSRAGRLAWSPRALSPVREGMDMQVDTLRGPMNTEDLGFVVTHEHIFAHTEGLIHQFPQVWDEAAAIVDARRQLQEAYDAGVRTIIEHTVMGLGRDVPM